MWLTSISRLVSLTMIATFVIQSKHSRVVAAVLGDSSLNNTMTNSTDNETSNATSSTITTLSNTDLTDDSVVVNNVTSYLTTYTSNDTSNAGWSDDYWGPIPIQMNVVSGFDGASFVGGMLLSLAGMLIGFVAVNMYKRRMRYLSEYNNLS